MTRDAHNSQLERDLEKAEWLEREEMEDRDLVMLAQSGDRDSFGELIRRHRAKVYGYARSLTQESFLAEDLVQDALVRAFLHLGTLVDTERFLPWLHRIVRNQAYTKLRSQSFVKEQVFSALPQHSAGEGAGENWGNLDYILHRLSRTHEAAELGANPEEQLLRKELLELIAGLLRCLNRRERQVFESYFFDHLSPQEIAEMFKLSSGNVYQLISRSRRKVAQEKLRVSVDHYMNTRRDWGSMEKVVLHKTAAFKGPGTWTTAAAAMHGMLSYTDKGMSLPMVMGLGGFAFRISIIPDDVHIAGPTSYSFKNILSGGFRTLGYRTRIVNGMKPIPGPNANLVDPILLTSEAKQKRQLHEALPEALDLIHRSIDKGIPVLSWDLFIPEFGLIYGYDDHERQLTAVECWKDDTLPYDHLGRGILEELFLVAIEEPIKVDQRSQLRGALQMILDHYHNREEWCSNSVYGLEAYDTWIAAFRGGKIEPNGNAYNAAVIQDARSYASSFFNELAGAWQGESESDGRLRQLSLEAAEWYKRIADELRELKAMFPFPAGGEPNNPVNAESSIRILQSVQQLERQAVALLENMSAEVEVSGELNRK